MDQYIGMARRYLAAEPGMALEMLFGGWEPAQLHELGKMLIAKAKEAGHKPEPKKPVRHYGIVYSGGYDRGSDQMIGACWNTEIVRRHVISHYNITRIRKNVTCKNCLRTKEFRKAMGEDVEEPTVHHITRATKVYEQDLKYVNVDLPFIPYLGNPGVSLGQMAYHQGYFINLNDLEDGARDYFRGRVPTSVVSCNSSWEVEYDFDETQYTTDKGKVTCKTCLRSRAFAAAD